MRSRVRQPGQVAGHEAQRSQHVGGDRRAAIEFGVLRIERVGRRDRQPAGDSLRACVGRRREPRGQGATRRARGAVRRSKTHAPARRAARCSGRRSAPPRRRRAPLARQIRVVHDDLLHSVHRRRGQEVRARTTLERRPARSAAIALRPGAAHSCADRRLIRSSATQSQRSQMPLSASPGDLSMARAPRRISMYDGVMMRSRAPPARAGCWARGVSRSPARWRRSACSAAEEAIRFVRRTMSW